ncbi:TetR/AcrR family transcriptional regulator [Paenibacillus caui]|uniref:TetR/AcrR family transcriptional regulator n=1 Tax=Paenibacillus caui TaxID=2873927 RepID=UPI001CA8BC92|nr:TetR/AcrR family transcriptional regulator [Paenibacillus caui]
MPNNKEPDELSLKIQETAKSLFDRLGIEEVSMHRIAKEAGIGQGTLYRRYPSKSKLCLSLMENKFKRLIGEIEGFLQSSQSLPVMQRLSWMMSKLILNLDEDLEGLKVLMSSGRLEEAKANHYQCPPFIFIRDKIEELLKEAADQGESVPLDPAFTSVMIASSLKPELIQFLHDLGYDTEQIAAKYCQCVIEPLFRG